MHQFTRLNAEFHVHILVRNVISRQDKKRRDKNAQKEIRIRLSFCARPNIVCVVVAEKSKHSAIAALPTAIESSAISANKINFNSFKI